MAQMVYSLACLRLSLLCFASRLIPYFIKGLISWSNYRTGSCTKMFLTTLRATMIPQTPIPVSNHILASMPNIYLNDMERCSSTLSMMEFGINCSFIQHSLWEDLYLQFLWSLSKTILKFNEIYLYCRLC